MTKLRVLFMGTPDFAVPTLQALYEDGHYEVVGVFTQPDKPRGRGQRLTPSKVKEWATKYNLPVYQPVKIREEIHVKEIKALRPDVIVVVAYGQILSEEILNIPPLGAVNVHASLLPKYRGAAPMQAALINGDRVTGITTMLMAKGLDTGDMLLKREYPLTTDTTLGELHDAMMNIGAKLLIETLEGLQKGVIKGEVQDDSLSSYAPMITKDMLVVDWQKSASEIHNLVRGLSPVPCVQAELAGNVYKLGRTRLAMVSESECKEDVLAGQIAFADKERGLIVKTGDGLIEIVELKPAGKKMMLAKDFLNGHSFKLVGLSDF